MGLDCNYQGIPSDLSILEKAKSDSEFSENVFYPFIAFTKTLEGLYYFKEPEFEDIRSLFQKYPKIKNWNYSPVSRMQFALVYVLSPQTYDEFEDLRESFYYKFVMGESKFSEELSSTIGVPVRISSPSFVKECVEYTKTVTTTELLDNFDAFKMESLGIYKVWSESSPEPVIDYFLKLCDFYREIDSYENLSVFVTID